MFKWVMALILALGIGIGSVATAQEVDLTEKYPTALFVEPNLEIEFVVTEPNFALFIPAEFSEGFQLSGQDFGVLAGIPLVRKQFDLPLNMDVSAELDVGGVASKDSDLAGYIGASVGGLEQPIVWAVKQIPSVGETLGNIVDIIDGRIGYAYSFDLQGNTEHGLMIGLITLEFEF